MKHFYCDICNAPMVLDVRLSNVHRKGNVYRRRRFKCTICDFKKTIYANGDMDEMIIPQQGIDEVKSKFRKEEINRLGWPL